MTMTTQQQYETLRKEFNEQQWRLFLGTEALKIGYGGISQVAALSGADWKTVQRGVKELKGELPRTQGRIRQAGGGRKKAMETDPTLCRDLEELLEPKGDPMSFVKWTTHSLTHLVKALSKQGHTIKKSALAELLHELGYSLKANKKTIEGVSHPDRDQQFGHINILGKQFEQKQAPAISVDCKKKELLGTFKNHGREWQPKGQQTLVNVYDFRSLADGKAIPYGIYDLLHNQGFVNVGVDHETAEFAVESIRRWWKYCGKKLYPKAHELLFTADGGGSNGVRNKLWKKALQMLANEEQLTITVAHYPPATSKWNKIEHRLFSFISMNWRAKPLTSLETVIELISHTSTNEGLQVTAIKDSHTYPTGMTVTDAELSALNMLRASFHGEWNYTIKPQDTLVS
jgi:transposase